MRAYRKLLKPRRRWIGAVWFAALALLAAALGMAFMATQYLQSASQWEQALQEARARRVVPRPVTPSRAALEEQRRWAALANERAFSWYPVFRSLEQANSTDIELLEFVPDKGSRRITLRGEARSLDALTDYVAALQVQPALAEVYLARQKNISRGGMALQSFEIRAALSE